MTRPFRYFPPTDYQDASLDFHGAETCNASQLNS